MQQESLHNMHESSKCHTESVLKMLALPSSTPNIALFIGHGFFFGIMFSLKNKCCFCVLGGVFLRKKRWLLGLRPRPPWGSLQRSPIPPGWARGAPPSRTLPGGLRHLTLAAALLIPFLRHCCSLPFTGKNIVFPAWILYNDPRLITTKSTVNFVNSLSTWEIIVVQNPG